MSQNSDSLHLAGCWLLDSGIQESSGGVARYYRPDLGTNARISTEITGYVISALVYLGRRTGSSRFLNAALRAAGFLRNDAWDRGLSLYPFECGANGTGGKALAYFFDSGIIARGLLSLWRAGGDETVLAAAVDCGESMRRDFTREGIIHPVLRLPDKQPLAHEGNWSRNPGCYQLKSAMAWHELFQETGSESFRVAYERALDSALGSHTSFLPGSCSRDAVMDRLHAYCYFLEGLLPSARRQECLNALRWGISRVAELLRQISPAFERSDVRAQLLRIRLFAERLGGVPVDRRAAEEEALRLSAYQFEHPDSKIHGGFWFGRKGLQLLPYVNPVSTVFGLQALDMWRQYKAGVFEADCRDLI